MLLDLVPVYMTDRRPMIERLAADLERPFLSRVRTRVPWFDPETSYDGSRGQYNSTILLRMLLEDPDPRGDRIIGVTSVDLFIPVLTYVFGEAQLEGRAAVVSIHRLRPEAYGLALDDELLYARLKTEAVHELGHTFGLLHCADPGCAMHASTYVEEIDLKTSRLCKVCRRAVVGPAVRGG